MYMYGYNPLGQADKHESQGNCGEEGVGVCIAIICAWIMITLKGQSEEGTVEIMTPVFQDHILILIIIC